MKKLKILLLKYSFFSLSILFFFIFYYQYIFGGETLSSNYAQYFLYPGIYNLKEALKGNEPFFYTEKVLSGYPIFQIPELGYLNPLRILITYIFDFKMILPVEFTIFFLVGVLGFYKLLRAKKISEPSIFFAHFIFFYNPVFMKYFEHQAFIKSLFLLPLSLYFITKIFSESQKSKRKKYLVLNVFLISLSLILGDYLATLILLISQFVFLFAEHFDKEKIKDKLIFILITTLAPIGFTFYSLYNFFELYLNSVESGSIWFLVSKYNFINTTINTQGLGSIVFIFLGFLFLKNIQFKKFFISSIFLMIISIFIAFINFEVIFYLGLSLIFASIAHHLLNTYEKSGIPEVLINLIAFIVPVLPFVYFLIAGGSLTLDSLYSYRNQFISVFFILSLLMIYKLTHRKSLLIVIPIIVVSEFVFFLNYNYQSKISDIQIIDKQISEFTSYYPEKRLTFVDFMSGNQNLYYNSWGIYGYNTFIPRDYDVFMKKNNLLASDYSTKNYFNQKVLKVYRTIDSNGNILAVSDGKLFDHDYQIISQNSESKKYLFELTQPSQIKSFIKFDKNIEVYINKQKVENLVINDIFYTLNLNSGKNEVEFIYNPKTLYLGLVMSLLFSIFNIVLIKKLWS